MKQNKISSFVLACLVGLTVFGCKEKHTEPDFPPTKAYYAFRVFNPTDPRQPRNEVGFDSLTYRTEDGTTRILTNRTLHFTNDYDTTIYANVPADRVLEGYLAATKAQSVSIEIGLIDKSGAKRKLDYKLMGRENPAPASMSVVRVELSKEVAFKDIIDNN